MAVIGCEVISLDLIIGMGNVLMFGVRNIHCGSKPCVTSLWNIVKFLDLARRSSIEVTES